MGKKWKRLQKIQRAKAARLSAEAASQEVVEAPAPTTKKGAAAPAVEVKETVKIAEETPAPKAKKAPAPKAKKAATPKAKKTAKPAAERTTKK